MTPACVDIARTSGGQGGQGGQGGESSSVGLVSLVQFPAGALWSVRGQDSLFHIASVYPAE